MPVTRATMADALRRAGFPESLITVMVAVGLAESGGDPNAHNVTPREDSRGVWQINTKAHPQYRSASIYDVYNNARAAYEVYKREGLDAWTTYTSGAYREHLDGDSGASSGVSVPVRGPTNPALVRFLILATGIVLLTLAVSRME